MKRGDLVEYVGDDERFKGQIGIIHRILKAYINVDFPDIGRFEASCQPNTLKAIG